MTDDHVLPRIDEECISVFDDSLTEAEMLECISGHNSLSRSCEVVTDSGLYSEKDDDHTNNTVPHDQDHNIMSEKHMVHAFDNNSVLSTSSSNSDDDDDEEITSHPDYYTTAAQRTTSTISKMSGDCECSNEVGQCSDHCSVIIQHSLASEDGGVAFND